MAVAPIAIVMNPAIESRERLGVRAGEIVGRFELTSTHTNQI